MVELRRCRLANVFGRIHRDNPTATRAYDDRSIVLITPGLEAVVVSIVPISIHGDAYVDVVLTPAGSSDPVERLTTRLGTEAIEGDLRPGDRVRVLGFLRTVTALRRIG